MIYHLPVANGLLPAIHRLFETLQSETQLKDILYLNSTLPAALSRALSQSTESWTKDPLRTQSFHYERVLSVQEAIEQATVRQWDFVVVEGLDSLAQETTDLSYPEQNRDLIRFMLLDVDLVCLDSCEYLDKYFVRVPFTIKKEQADTT